MSNTDWDNNNFDDTNDGDNLVNQLRKQLREMEKRTKAQDEDLRQARTALRERAIKEQLESRGLNAKVARFVPDSIDPTEEAISAWLADNADVFGAATVEVQQQVQVQAPKPNVDLTANQRIQSVAASAESPGYEEDMLARINAAKTPEELTALINGLR